MRRRSLTKISLELRIDSDTQPEKRPGEEQEDDGIRHVGADIRQTERADCSFTGQVSFGSRRT